MTAARFLQLVGGCAVLAVGVGMLLVAELGADGFSMLCYGVYAVTGVPFVLANLAVAAAFVALAWAGGLRPGLGTAVQMIVVGATVDVVLRVLPQPDSLAGRAALAAAGIVVLATGIALYLGTRLGAGPAEAPALAFDPPVPFVVTYYGVQGGGALVGWLLGAAIGPGTIAVVLLLGPLVRLTARLFGQDIHQPRQGEPRSALQ